MTVAVRQRGLRVDGLSLLLPKVASIFCDLVNELPRLVLSAEIIEQRCLLVPTHQVPRLFGGGLRLWSDRLKNILDFGESEARAATSL